MQRRHEHDLGFDGNVASQFVGSFLGQYVGGVCFDLFIYINMLGINDARHWIHSRLIQETV
jgi:hypothetical protein